MHSNLLTIKNLAISFKTEKGIINVVNSISLDIKKGETTALLGNSGSGKSITALSILGLLPYPKAFHPKGEIFFKNTQILNISEVFLRKIRGNNISMIFQEPMTSLNPIHTIGNQILEVLCLHKNMKKNIAKSKVIALLDTVGLGGKDKRFNFYPHQLSGGQRQRVMIAMALACEPDLLIADEPTTALDVTIQDQILDLILSLQKKIGMAVLLITHDLRIVKKMAKNVYIMHEGTIIEYGEKSKLFKSPNTNHTKNLLTQNIPKKNISRKGFNNHSILIAKNIKVSFPVYKGIFRKKVDEIIAVNNINLDIKIGQTIGIVGESGSGKTSIGQAIAKIIESEGTLIFNGIKIDKLNWNQMRPYRKNIQYIFQDPYGSLSPRLPVYNIIAEGLEISGLNIQQSQIKIKVEKILKKVGMDPATMYRYPHEFSGGQRQRIAIARALIVEPALVILDEPTSALDITVQIQIINLLLKLQKDLNLTYIFISHDLNLVQSISDSIIVLKDGKVVEQGLTKIIFKNANHHYTKSLIKASQ